MENGNYLAQHQLGLLHIRAYKQCITIHNSIYESRWSTAATVDSDHCFLKQHPSLHNTDVPRASTQAALFNNLPDLQPLIAAAIQSE